MKKEYANKIIRYLRNTSLPIVLYYFNRRNNLKVLNHSTPKKYKKIGALLSEIITNKEEKIK